MPPARSARRGRSGRGAPSRRSAAQWRRTSSASTCRTGYGLRPHASSCRASDAPAASPAAVTLTSPLPRPRRSDRSRSRSTSSPTPCTRRSTWPGDAVQGSRQPGAGPGRAEARHERARSSSACWTSTTSRSRASAGTDVVAVGALVGKPLAALVAQPGRRAAAGPRGPHGRRLRAPVRPRVPEGDRRPRRRRLGEVKQVTIGFNAVSRLLTKRVDAVPVFWNAEGVALKQRGLEAQRVPRRGLRRAAVPRGRALHLARDAGGASARIEAALDAIARRVGAARRDPARRST